MNREEFIEFHNSLHRREQDIIRRKNHDYAGSAGDDPFANFRRSEALGICTTAQGIMVRISDKISRLAEYEKSGKLLVVDESVLDTIMDSRNYHALLAGYLASLNPGLVAELQKAPIPNELRDPKQLWAGPERLEDADKLARLAEKRGQGASQ